MSDYDEFGSGFRAQYDYVTEANREDVHPVKVLFQLVLLLLLGALVVWVKNS